MNKTEKNNCKLQCRYCGVIMDIDRHSACEHSNSAYDIATGQYDIDTGQMLLTDFMEGTEG